MPMENEKTKDILQWISKAKTFSFNAKTEKLKSSLKLAEDYKNKYEPQKKKQPYHINVIDELRANENAHSRILRGLLMQQTEGEYELFKSFAKNVLSDFNVKVEKPIVSAEKHRIDLLIQEKGKYAIIIENKINFAEFQHNQFARYIDIMRGKGYKLEQIYLVYLPPYHYTDIPDHCWETTNEESNKEKHSYHKNFKDRFISITFRDNILSWLETFALPNCRVKDIYLQSAIIQYIDHLKGKFNIRTINDKMNMELQEFLRTELGLNQTIDENLNKIKAKIKDINDVRNQLSNLERSIKCEAFNEWEKKLKNKFPKLTIDKSAEKDTLKLVISRECNGIKFNIYIQDRMIEEISYGCSGLSRVKKNQELTPIILSAVDKNINNQPTDWSYVKVFTTYSEVYEKFESFVDKVLEVTK